MESQRTRGQEGRGKNADDDSRYGRHLEGDQEDDQERWDQQNGAGPKLGEDSVPYDLDALQAGLGVPIISPHIGEQDESDKISHGRRGDHRLDMREDIRSRHGGGQVRRIGEGRHPP